MRDGETLAFVEVKARRNAGDVAPAEAVNAFKRRQITRTALHYLQANGLDDASCRFDVVEILLADGSPPEVRHSMGVFDAEAWE